MRVHLFKSALQFNLYTMKIPKILFVFYLMSVSLLCFGQGRVSRPTSKKENIHHESTYHKSNDKQLISQAQAFYLNGEYEKAWDKLMKVRGSQNDTTYLMLLGDIGYIYKPNSANGGRWCYEKAARLGCKSGELKSRCFFRSRTIATYSSSTNPGDSLNKLGFSADGPERLEYFKKAANLGSTTAMVNLGRAFEKGRDIELSFSNAAQLYIEAYNIDKNPDAAEHLAWLYSLGLGVPQDLNKTFELYSRARHVDRNQVNLAICYDFGIGTNQNRMKALEMYSATLCNHTDNEDWLNYVSKRIISITQNEGIDIPLNKSDGNIGNLYYNLYRYINRFIINNNEAKQSEKTKYKTIAGQYLELALSNGVTGGDALNNLGNILKERKEYDKAIVLYLQSANKYKESTAYWNLGDCYENGLGVTQDLHKAKQWYEKAKAAGNWGAEDALKRLKKKGV